MERDVVIELYKETMAARRDFNERMDNSLKYFTTIFSALITVSISARVLSYQVNSFPAQILAAFPILALFILFIGLLELRRIYNRYMEQTATSQKAEKWLGLHDEVGEDKRFYPEDPYILPTRFVQAERRHRTSEAFIDGMMRTWGSSLWRGKVHYISLMTALFLGYILASIGMMVWLLFF